MKRSAVVTSLVLSLFLATSLTPARAAAPTTPPLTGYAAKAGGTVLDVPIPGSLLATPLVDQSGKSFTLASLKGKTVVLTNFMTTCNDICPMTTVNMREMSNRFAALGMSKKIVGLELSIDAKRDRPSRMKAYADLYGGSPWTLATGNAANLASIWSWFGAYTKVVPSDSGIKDWQTGKPVTYDVQHEDIVVVIGPNLHWRWLDLGNPAVSQPKAANVLPAKIRTFLSATGKINLMTPQQPFWTTAAVYGALDQIFGLKI
jgi:protein SCO1/2